MIIHPQIQGCVARNCHPIGCRAAVLQQIASVRAAGQFNGPKRVLVLPRRQTLDLNFVLQFAVQEHLQVQQIHAMARRATTFKDPCSLDVEAALAGVQQAMAG